MKENTHDNNSFYTKYANMERSKKHWEPKIANIVEARPSNELRHPMTLIFSVVKK